MSDHDDFFEEFNAHTKFKHLVLAAYLEEWAYKILQEPRFGPRAWYVDGFAGPGKDKANNDGSPTIACRTAIKVRSTLQRKPSTASHRLGVFCIEKRAKLYAELDQHLEPFARVEPALVRTERGTLPEHLQAVLKDTAGPLLTFLDPFGVVGLDAATYAPLLARRGSELFALLGTEGAARITAAYQRSGNKFETKLAERTATLPLFPDLHSLEVSELRAKAEQQHNRNTENDAKNLASYERALGSQLRALWVLEGPHEGAAQRLATCFKDALIDAGADYVIFLPITNADGRPEYTLVYATKSEKGVVTMKACVCRALKKSSLPATLREKVQRDLEIDLAPIVDAVRDSFAGKIAPWAQKAKGSVQSLLYARTSLFPFQRKELEDSLEEAGILKWIDGKRMIAVPERP
jgi:three-Cys-motif partner protein